MTWDVVRLSRLIIGSLTVCTSALWQCAGLVPEAVDEWKGIHTVGLETCIVAIQSTLYGGLGPPSLTGWHSAARMFGWLRASCS